MTYGMGMNTMYRPAASGYMPSVAEDKGKGKSREADFEAAFAQYATQSSSRIVEVDDNGSTVDDLTDSLTATTLETTSEFKPCVPKYPLTYLSYRMIVSGTLSKILTTHHPKRT